MGLTLQVSAEPVSGFARLLRQDARCNTLQPEDRRSHGLQRVAISATSYLLLSTALTCTVGMVVVGGIP